jgi:hypothetical protein
MANNFNLWINIQGEHGTETFKFHKDYARYSKLRDELLARFPNNPEVKLTNKKGIEVEVLKLFDLFNTK